MAASDCHVLSAVFSAINSIEEAERFALDNGVKDHPVVVERLNQLRAQVRHTFILFMCTCFM